LEPAIVMSEVFPQAKSIPYTTISKSFSENQRGQQEFAVYALVRTTVSFRADPIEHF
jgi:hypothetical protein